MKKIMCKRNDFITHLKVNLVLPQLLPLPNYICINYINLNKSKKTESMKLLKLLYLLSFVLLLTSCGEKHTQTTDIAIIPAPQQLEKSSGSFKINKSTTIFAPKAFKQEAEFLAEFINRPTGFNIQVTTDIKNIKKENCIVFIKNSVTPKDGYKLSINKKSVEVKSSDNGGAFYAVQTMRQLLPTSIEQIDNKKTQNYLLLPCLKITDQPRFKWRGLHLDVSRNFFDVKFIKKVIDYLALHKMNIFHWHLVDDQGWRIEIKKYPLLTEIASIREETVIGKNSGKYDGKQYGPFFYTQDEVRDVVEYARKRNITVVPEIEMPGHTQAVLAAYPEYGCTGKRTKPWTQWGVSKEVYCAGQDKTFTFLQDILDEVCELFPSEYIHIGGDECPKVRWEKCPKCQKRIKTEGLKDEHELQSYFITRIEKFLSKKGKRLVGWDEILEGGLNPNATVMAWRGMHEGVKAAKQHNDVVMSPTSHCYLDYHQSKHLDIEPFGIGGHVPLKKVYSLEPVPAELSAEEQKYIIGAQVNLWSEYVPTNEHAEYLILPRLSAIAEVNWSAKKDKDWNSFATRLMKLFDRFNAMGINFSKSSLLVNASVYHEAENGEYQIKLESELPSGDIYYTTNGEEPTIKSSKYTKPFNINKTSEIKACSFINGQKSGITTKRDFNFHKATFKDVKVLSKPHKNYTPKTNRVLVDGCFGTTSYKTSEWVGMYGDDFVSVIDLGKSTEVSEVIVSALRNQASHIILPIEVECFVSDDNKNFRSVGKSEYKDAVKKNLKAIKSKLSTKFSTVNARYIKVVAKNTGALPARYEMPKNKAYLFVDEVEVL